MNEIEVIKRVNQVLTKEFGEGVINAVLSDDPECIFMLEFANESDRVFANLAVEIIESIEFTMSESDEYYH